MRRDYKQAVKVLVNALYDRDDYEDGCRQALEALDPDLALLLEENEEAAKRQANDEEEDPEDFEPIGTDEF